jgi:hypothetical protein
MATIEEINELERRLADMKREVAIPPGPPKPLKLDLGCGALARRVHNKTTKEEGYTGVDILQLPGVDIVGDLIHSEWPWPDNSVDEAICSHFLEHVPAGRRAHFANELWRVLKKDAKATFVTPHWLSERAYGDPTHEWPPICEMTWAYFDAKWREESTISGPWKCDLVGGTKGYSESARIAGYNQERKLKAFSAEARAAEDMVSILTARK